MEFIAPLPDSSTFVIKLLPLTERLCFSSFRLLQSKPEAVRKALSENSLLKNIDFNEKFLAEENVTESKMSLFFRLLFGQAESENLHQI